MTLFVAAAFAAAPAILLGAAALRYRRGMKRLGGELSAQRRAHGAVLEAARIVTAASRDSSDAVLGALHASIVSIESAIDTVLVYRCDGEELVCTYSGGARGAHFAATRLRIDDVRTLPARAASKRCSVGLDTRASAVIATDRDAIAVPMEDAAGLQAVVYASSPREVPQLRRDAVARCIAHAAAPYGLALDREADRANATYDALTGLYSPRAFREALKRQLAAARLTERTTISLWFVDTDRFKVVNDTFGHRAGDDVLRQMAALLREHTVSGVDVAARNGGDEFCAIVRDVPKTAAIERAQQFCNAVNAFDFGVGFSIGASIGVASYPYDAQTAEALLEIADAAMYHSKRSGRNCVSFAVNRSFAVYR